MHWKTTVGIVPYGCIISPLHNSTNAAINALMKVVWQAIKSMLGRWFHHQPRSANSSRLLGMYLSEANRDGWNTRNHTTRERRNGRFSQNRQRV